MKKFLIDIKKYYHYILYGTKAELKSEVANSRLNAIWWVLDPILFMLVYTFVVSIVFDRGDETFPIFVFIGLTIWNFFNRTTTISLKLVRSNRGTISKVYIPKYVLIIQNVMVSSFKMLVSFFLIFIMILIYDIPLTLNLLHIIPLLIFLLTLTFAISTIFLHFGVFVQDLSNVVNALFKLMFYMSGILYSIPELISESYSWLLLNLNPIALIINEFRNAIMYNMMPNYTYLFIWFIISLIVSYIGIRTIQKYENSYVKVI